MKTKMIFKSIWFYFILINFVAFLSMIIVGIAINDWSYTYGYLLYFPFGLLSSLAMYVVGAKKITNSFLIFTWIGRYLLKCVPIVICIILYSVDIEKINILGVLIGVIISLLESFIYAYLTYIAPDSKKKKEGDYIEH